jgi:flagellar biosynthesis/type III secretory pathway protein FliH
MALKCATGARVRTSQPCGPMATAGGQRTSPTTRGPGTAAAWREGREAGREVGREEGRQEGQVVTSRKILIMLAEPRLGKLTPRVKKRLDSISDADVLEKLIIQAVTANSWDELLK